jgi:hypothetical protein
VPTYPVNSDGSLRWISDAPMGGVAALIEGGDDLIINTDWNLDASRQQVQLISPPVREVLADASSIGRLEPVAGDDVWLSVANPFSGTNGLTPTGITGNGSGGMAGPVYNSSALVGGTPGGAGKPPYQSGAVFQNGPAGGLGIATRTGITVAPGGSVRYQIQADVKTKLLVCWSADPKDAIVTITKFGYFEGTITNPYANARQVYLIALGDNTGGNAATVISAIFYALQQSGSDLVPAKIERAVSEIMGRCKKANWANFDLAAIDSATNYAGIGYWTKDKNATANSVLSQMLDNYGASKYGGLSGQLRFARMVDPSVQTASYSLTINETSKVAIVPDDAPALSLRMAYRPNAVQMSSQDFVSDLLDVPVSKRNMLMARHRGVVYSSVQLAPRYRNAAELAEPFESMFWRERDAQAEIDRIASIYSIERNFYLVEIEADVDFRQSMGTFCRLIHPRHGLALGKTLMLVRRVSNVLKGNHSLTFWG